MGWDFLRQGESAMALAGIVLTLGMAFGQADGDAEAIAALNSPIADLVGQLSCEGLAVREAGPKARAEIGIQARAALEAAAKSPDPETALRARGLLDRLPKITHTVVDGSGAPIPLAKVVLTVVKRLPGSDAPIV